MPSIWHIEPTIVNSNVRRNKIFSILILFCFLVTFDNSTLGWKVVELNLQRGKLKGWLMTFFEYFISIAFPLFPLLTNAKVCNVNTLVVKISAIFT